MINRSSDKTNIDAIENSKDSLEKKVPEQKAKLKKSDNEKKQEGDVKGEEKPLKKESRKSEVNLRENKRHDEADISIFRAAIKMNNSAIKLASAFKSGKAKLSSFVDAIIQVHKDTFKSKDAGLTHHASSLVNSRIKGDVDGVEQAKRTYSEKKSELDALKKRQNHQEKKHKSRSRGIGI